MTLNIEQIQTDINCLLQLDQNISANGVYVDTDGYINRVNLDNMVISQTVYSDLTGLTTLFSQDITYITGITNSKLGTILTQDELNGNFNRNNLGKPILISGSDLVAIIENYDVTNDSYYYKYYIGVGTSNPILYEEINGRVTYKTIPNDDYTSKPVYMLYDSIAEEPKIQSSVFIDRGANSVFESISKLNKTRTLQELKKTGLGFFKVNKNGIL